MSLSASFTLASLCASETAIRRGIPNVPNAEQIANLTDLAQTLEQVKQLVGPIHINSAFRSVRLNTAIGGSPHSAHLDGYAGDIVCPGRRPIEVCQAIAGSGIPFDQLICEGSQEGHPETGWTHISVAPAMRKEVLTGTFVSGKVVYSAGLGSQPELT